MESSSDIPKKISDLLPLKQRLVMDLESKLSGLRESYSHITYCIDDKDLSENMGDVLEKLGFTGYQISGSNFQSCFPLLKKMVIKNHLVLLQYNKKVDGSSLVSLLNELGRHQHNRSLKNIVPIILASITTEKEQELLRYLSRYEILYVIFLNPESQLETRIEGLFDELYQFQEKIVKGELTKEVKPPEWNEADETQNEIINRYKKLLAEAEECMQSDPDRAIELFTTAIELKPDFDTLMRRGDAYFLIREYLLALQDYREANKLEQDRANPYSKIGSCCFLLVKEAAKSEDKEKAKKWFSLGIQSIQKAKSLIDQREKEEGASSQRPLTDSYKHILSSLAVADFRDLGLEEEEEEIDLFLSKVLFDAKNVNFLDPALDVNARIDYAVLLTRKKNYQEADSVFRGLIQNDPANVGPAFNNFAVELRKNGEFEKAFQVYLELLKYDIPDRYIVLKNMVTAGRKYAQWLRDESRFEEAIASYKNILIYASKIEGREWILCDLASTYLEINDPAQACSRLLEAAYVNSKLTQAKEFHQYKDLVDLKQEIFKKLFKPSG